MKKIAIILIITMMLVLLFTLVSYADVKQVELDKQYIQNGIIGIKVSNIESDKIKVLVKKDEKKIYYNIKENTEFEYFPLQLGNGEYKIAVLENVEKNRYSYIYKEFIEFSIEDENIIYLNSIQLIKWDNDNEAIKLADELIKDCETDLKKVQNIYNYIVENVSYDEDKKELAYDYVPNIDTTISEQKGICYDYASLFSAMLRSQGIPAKLVKGYSEYTQTYHAWNEVYISELDKWVTIDTTKGSAYIKSELTNNMIEDSSKYDKKYEY